MIARTGEHYPEKLQSIYFRKKDKKTGLIYPFRSLSPRAVCLMLEQCALIAFSYKCTHPQLGATSAVLACVMTRLAWLLEVPI